MMSDNARSPDARPWEHGELCKASSGTCLPPRKRLLAGWKQSGLLPSTLPGFQGAYKASLPLEQLTLEVKLPETQHLCTNGAPHPDSPVGDCKPAGEPVSVSVKRKRAIKRRKSLAVLEDCPSSVKSLREELLKSCSGGQSQENVRGNEVFVEPRLSSKKEKRDVHRLRRMVVSAIDAAAKAAKIAAEAKAIALEKAVAAAKSAEIARAALEAAAIAAEDALLKNHPRRHSLASCEELKAECGFERTAFPFSRFPLNQGTNGHSDNISQTNVSNSSVGSMDTKYDEEIKAVHHPVDDLHSVDRANFSTAFKGHNCSQSSQTLFGVANLSDFIDKHEDAQQPSKLESLCCPMPHAFDDESLAQQLHRAMNSSPRISRSRVSLENCNGDMQPGQCSLSRKKNQPYQGKLGVLRSCNGKGEFNSMTAIDKTLSRRPKRN